jgi:hypothetical protein
MVVVVGVASAVYAFNEPLKVRDALRARGLRAVFNTRRGPRQEWHRVQLLLAEERDRARSASADATGPPRSGRTS